MPSRLPALRFPGTSGTGFSLWGLVLAKTKTHRLKLPLTPELKLFV